MPISEVGTYTDFNISAEAVKRCNLEQLIKRNVRERKQFISIMKKKILFSSPIFSIEFTLEDQLKQFPISMSKYTALVN